MSSGDTEGLPELESGGVAEVDEIQRRNHLGEDGAGQDDRRRRADIPNAMGRNGQECPQAEEQRRLQGSTA